MSVLVSKLTAVKVHIVFVSFALLYDHNLYCYKCWHVYFVCQLLKLLCDDSNCEGIIMINVTRSIFRAASVEFWQYNGRTEQCNFQTLELTSVAKFG